MAWTELTQTMEQLEEKEPIVKETISYCKRDIIQSEMLWNRYILPNKCDVVELFDIQNSSASKFLAKLVQAEVIESVFGYGKGKYHFRK